MMSRDLRQYARQTTLRLIVGSILLVLILGDGLIYLFYGSGAALLGLICIAGGLLPPALIALIFWGIDWILKRADRE